jgi:SAM-dependent methyltransferase
MDYKRYWTEDGLKNLVAGHTNNPEGFDVRIFLKNLLEKEPQISKVHELGCGAGRLCSVTSPDKYVGTDLNPHAITAAKKNNPEYNFQEVQIHSDYPPADVTMAYTVFLHMDDITLESVIRRIAAAGHRYILVSEILGREWRRGGNPPVFNRSLDDYLVLMQKVGYVLQRADDRVYQHYASQALKKNVRVFGLLFRKEVLDD